jgi:anti-sigma regulatory factor (Ser/Thr protein kinase)
MRELLKFKIDNDFKELKILNRSVRTFLGTIGVASKTIYKVNLVLEEIITNIIKYGYNDIKKHEIEVNINITAEHIRIRIIDDGNEFDAAKFPSPNTDTPLDKMRIGGLGIFLVKNHSNNIKYKRHKKKNILRVKIYTTEAGE